MRPLSRGPVIQRSVRVAHAFCLPRHSDSAASSSIVLRFVRYLGLQVRYYIQQSNLLFPTLRYGIAKLYSSICILILSVDKSFGERIPTIIKTKSKVNVAQRYCPPYRSRV